MRREPRAERGAVIPLFVIAIGALLAATALSVDLGREMLRTRELQSIADVAALEAARSVDGRTVGELRSEVEAAVADAAQRNDETAADYEIEYGVYDAVLREFHAHTNDDSVPNAIRVEPSDDVDFYFIPGVGNTARDAVALELGVEPECAPGDPWCDPPFCPAGDPACVEIFPQEPEVDIAIGSVGLGFQQQLDPVTGSVHADAYVQALNARLKAAFDTDASVTPPPNGAGLDLLSYQGLAASQVSLGALAAAAGFGTPQELADATITNGDLFEATATALEAEGNAVAAAAVRSFAGRATFDDNGSVRLGGGPLLLEQGTGTADDPAAARATINVLDLLVGAATVVDGRNFASFQFSPAIPGVVSVQVDTRVVEPMQWRFGARLGQSVQNAQIRQQVTVSIDGAALGIPGLTAPISLPIVVEGATADATVTRIDCDQQVAASEADLLAVTSLARFRLGVAQNLQAEGNPALSVQSATLIEAGDYSLATVLYLGLSALFGLTENILGSSDVSVGGGSSSHTFLPAASPNPFQRAAGGVSANVGTSLQGSATTSLPLVGSANLLASLGSVFSALDSGILSPALHAAGVTLGGADLLAANLLCRAPILVD